MNRFVKIKLALVDKDHLIANRPGIADASGQWERKLEALTSWKRTVSLDRKFERGGFTLTVGDTNLAYQTMFANDTYRKIYGKTVTIYVYEPDDVTLADTVVASISGWKRVGHTVEFTCAQEFSGAMAAIPAAQNLVITAADFPDAPPRALGKPVLFPTGTCDSRWGKIECWKVIKRNVGLGIDAKYLITKSDPAGAARITSILDVFEDGVRVSSGGSNYSLLRDEDGWEYVNYNGTAQRVKVNVVAVSAPGTAGANPVVALRAVLAAAGVTLVDDGAGGTSDFQDFCTAQTWNMGGLPEGSPATQDYIETWCQNFNCFWSLDSAGAIHIKHLDWASITAAANLVDRHFLSFSEDADMNEFANRSRSKHDYGNASWSSEVITDSTDGDYLPAIFTKERSEEYLLAVFGGAATPYIEKLRFYDRVKQIATGSIDLRQYRMLGLGLVKVVHVTCDRQIGDPGKYLIMEEDEGFLSGIMTVKMFRLWGA